MIVKYVLSENEAYWVLLKDLPSPNQNNKTFTIRFPKKNKLSTINWGDIQEYINGVTKRKLAAQNVYRQAETRRLAILNFKKNKQVRKSKFNEKN